MFDEKEYREVFSQVTASDATFRRVMNMKYEKNRTARGRSFVTKILIAAALISVLAVTAGASESVSGWFRSYFGERSESGLTAEQGVFIEENEQIINDAQEQDGWIIELRSALSDGTKAYVIIGITAPEYVNLNQNLTDGVYEDWFGPGNGSLKSADKQPLLTCSVPDYVLKSYGFRLEEDGDGKNNTKNMVIELDPDFSRFADPFGRGTEWYIHIENIVHLYKNEAYHQELLNGKYKGQADIVFTSEETDNLYSEDVLAEGIWDFAINFVHNKDGKELLQEPMKAKAYVHRRNGSEIDDVDIVYETVTIKSFVLSPLGAVISCNEQNVNFENMDVVMKDGSKIILSDTGSAIDAEMPIILEQVDHILLADGTVIPVPEITE